MDLDYETLELEPQIVSMVTCEGCMCDSAFKLRVTFNKQKDLDKVISVFSDYDY